MSIEHSPSRQKIHGGTNTELEELLDFDDLARRWKCARKTIKMNYRRYGFRVLKINKRVLIPVSQVVAFEQKLIERGESST